MERICTTIEQSKKLIELGIDVNTSDMYWSLVNKNHPPIIGKYCAEYGGMQLPAWSLTALLELIPNFNMFKRTIECKMETTNHLVDKACDPIDAAFEMIVWLKENGKI